MEPDDYSPLAGGEVDPDGDLVLEGGCPRDVDGG